MIQTMAEKDALKVNIVQSIKNFVFETSNSSNQRNVGEDKNEQGLISLDNIKKYKFVTDFTNSTPLTAKTKTLIHLLKDLTYRRCLIFVEKKTLITAIQ